MPSAFIYAFFASFLATFLHDKSWLHVFPVSFNLTITFSNAFKFQVQLTDSVTNARNAVMVFVANLAPAIVFVTRKDVDQPVHHRMLLSIPVNICECTPESSRLWPRWNKVESRWTILPMSSNISHRKRIRFFYPSCWAIRLAIHIFCAKKIHAVYYSYSDMLVFLYFCRI